MDLNINKSVVAAQKCKWLKLKQKERFESINLKFLFLKKEKIRTMQDLLKKFSKVMKDVGLLWMAIYGTLLGLKRDPPSCPMPWDDDIDVVAKLSDRDNIIKACSPHFQVEEETEDNRIYILFKKKVVGRRKMQKGVVETKWPFVTGSNDLNDELFSSIEEIKVQDKRNNEMHIPVPRH